MEKKKNYKKAARLYFICALCFYIASMLNKFKGSTGITYLCLGSTFLCLGSVYLNKSNEEEKEEQEDNENQDDK